MAPRMYRKGDDRLKRKTKKKAKPKSTTRRVLEYLMDHGDTAATCLGAAIWRDLQRNNVYARSNGGGDYAMQMMLGRMRREGLVQTAIGEGSSQWYITPLGRKHVSMGIA